MGLVHNEQTKLLATALNNIAVALVVIGVITPVTAISFEVPNAPHLKPGAALFALIWLFAGIGSNAFGTARAPGSETMSSGEIFVTFVIPAVLLTVAYIAVLLNERAARRLDQLPGE